MSAALEPIVGRYLSLTLNGKAHRIYFEEAGAGIPLLCLHTGGADTRQYRHLMLDAAVTAHYRVIAFDLPFHGKSTPPDGWHTQEYRLTLEDYTNTILAFSAALGLDRPALIGCSIGGRIVLHLAMSHPRAFRAMIGIACAVSTTPWYDTEWLHRPDVHAPLGNALVLHAERSRRVQGRSLFLSPEPGTGGGRRKHRHRYLSAVPHVGRL